MRLLTTLKPSLTPSREPNNQGAILVITLLIVAALTALTLAFSEESRVELNLAQFSRETLQARQMAAAGFNLVLTEIDKPEDEKKKELEETKRDWAQFGPLIFPDPLPDGITVEARYLDESGKINLAYFAGLLKKKDDENASQAELVEIKEIESQLQRFFSVLGVDEASADSSLVACLEDWLDPKSDPNLDGAEDDYYQGLPNPYPCADGPLLTIDQIYLVKGFGDFKLNDENGEKRITDFLTIYGDDSGRININAAPKEVLLSLNEDVDADAIIQSRQEKKIEGLNDDIKKYLNIETKDISGKIIFENKNTEPCYSVEAKVKVQEAEVHLKAAVKQVKDKKNKEIVYWWII